jgi:hypothetical protein
MCSLNAFDRMPRDQDNDRSNYRDQQAVQIQTGHAGMPKRIEQPSAYHGADDSQYEVEHQSFAALVYNFASDESSQKSQDDPRKNRHVQILLITEADVAEPDAEGNVMKVLLRSGWALSPKQLDMHIHYSL